MRRDMTLANVLRTLRAESGLSQLALALATGAGNATYLCKLENGRAWNPSRAFLRRYIAAYTMLGCALTPAQIARLMTAICPITEAA